MSHHTLAILPNLAEPHRNLWGNVRHRPLRPVTLSPDTRDRSSSSVMSDELSGHLLRLWRDMQHLSAQHVDAGLSHLLAHLCQLLSADQVDWVLMGMRPSGTAWRMASRSYVCHADGVLPSEGPALDFSLAVGTGAHMNFRVIRQTGATNFETQDQDILSTAVGGLGRWLAWLALSHGPVNADAPLPPYQRRALMLLLTGLSEKQMASELDLSINTVHQYVTALYRGFGVRNRQSLVAKWLSGY